MERPSVDEIDLASERAGAAGHALLDRLRLPAMAEEESEGEAAAPILLPVELSLVGDAAADFEAASAMLHHCASLCNLLANQREQLHHTCAQPAVSRARSALGGRSRACGSGPAGGADPGAMRASAIRRLLTMRPVLSALPPHPLYPALARTRRPPLAPPQLRAARRAGRPHLHARAAAAAAAAAAPQGARGRRRGGGQRARRRRAQRRRLLLAGGADARGDPVADAALAAPGTRAAAAAAAATRPLLSV